MKKLIAGILAAAALFAVSAEAPKVSLSGKGKSQTFDTIQQALDAIGAEAGDYKITLPKGTYPEVLYYNGAANITLSGESKAKYGEDVVIACDNSGDIFRLKKYTSSQQKGRCVFEFEGSGNLTVENLTIINTFVRGSVKGSNTQAETIGFDSTGNLAAYNCAFKSHQDTLRMTGKSWFYKCYVEGDTDFIWMEESGIVALFEECEIHSVYDEKHKAHLAYIGAPRATIANKIGKGLVIYNCNVVSAEGERTLLGRTPWNSGYYNQIAFVANTTSGIDKELWQGKALTAKGIPETTIGWKLDAATAKSLGVDTKGRTDIIPAKEVKNEFNGREAILNRIYDISSLRYKIDSENYWDVKAFAAANGWSVSPDKSKSILGGEPKLEKDVYTFDGSQQYPTLKLEGFAQDSASMALLGQAGAKITIPLKGKALVTVTGFISGTGRIKAGNQGEAFYDVNTGSGSKTADCTYVVYDKKAKEVTITANSASYITKITVEADKTLKFIPVKSITVKSEEDLEELYGRKSLQFSAELNPYQPTNKNFTWEVSDESVAKISPTGLLKAANITEDKVISVKAVSCDEKHVIGEKTMKILKPIPGSFEMTWLDSPESSASLEGSCDDESVAKASKAAPSKGKWVFNGSRIKDDFAKGCLTYTDFSSPIVGRDTAYIDFPITAQKDLVINKIILAYGNHGTSNVGVQVVGIKGSEKTDILDNDSRKARNKKDSFEIDDFSVKAGETAKIRVILYGLNGNGDTEIAVGKTPTIATFTISGIAK